jgi:hypothetical protein
MEITGYTIEQLKDPFGIINGDRYEFFLDIEVGDDDELFNENGLVLKVLFGVDEDGGKILNYDLMERSTNNFIDLALEEDELETTAAFCSEHITLD